ncbi:ATP-binding protein [Deinococcus murrayi]|uniref:ATP-binding protein n=1 Tax=Deinococcus murrayi TaxID=68910 RepID=UPI000553A94A|nr:ATP-binding protein [Deinococcus murrayi]
METPPVPALLLLGSPEVRGPGGHVRLSGKGLLLLAYLALEGPQDRETLAALLWPHLPRADARNNLRVTLCGMRRKLPGVLEAGRTRVRAAPLWTDVGAFEEALAKGDLVGATRLWRGPLLDGVRAEPGPLATWLAGVRAAMRPPQREAPAVDPLLGGRLTGRELDRHALLRRLAETPLVTLHGLGGVGKTALARELAASWNRLAAAGEACYTDLSGAAGAGEVLVRVAQDLGVPGAQSLQDLGTRRRRQPGLLVLDHLDGVPETAAVVAALRAALPERTLLVVRRLPLELPGEGRYLLRPLATPPITGHPSWEETLAYPAAALFAERARAVRPGLVPDAAAVAAICAALDGLPLALEAAAAHCAVLTPAALLVQLERPLDLLGWPSRDPTDLAGRLAGTLAAVSPADGERLRAIAVLEGGATLEELALLLQEAPGTLLLALERLCAAGLLRCADAEGQSLFALPRLVRALVRVDAPGGALSAADTGALLRLLLGRLPACAAALRRGGGEQARATLLRLGPDVRAALAAAREVPRLHDPALRLCRALLGWWLTSGQQAEAQEWLEAFGAPHRLPLAWAAVGWSRGEVQATRQLEALWADPAHPLPDRALAATLLAGEQALPAELRQRWWERAQECGQWGSASESRWPEALATRLHALAAEDPAQRRRGLQRAHDLFSEVGDPWGMTLCALEVWGLRGERRTAASLRERVEEARDLGQPWALGLSLHMLGAWWLEQDRPEGAAPLLEPQLAAWQECGWRWGEALALGQAGEVAWRLGQRTLACRLLGLARVLRQAGGAARGSPPLEALDARLSAVPTTLRRATERQAWREALQTPPEACAAQGLRWLRDLQGAEVASRR